MPTKPLDRLLHAQGGECFFCKVPLSKADASVEHLVASSNGGGNSDGNCVACCKALNGMFGSKSLKEKIGLVLAQKGRFKCPNVPANAGRSSASLDDASRVIANLQQRGSSKPKTVKTLLSTVRSLFQKGIAEERLSQVLQQLEARGFLMIEGTKVTYAR
ncbi:MAG TPA: hypothetical protein VKE95_19130 [Burkholderiales bacterium]|nr:hypothetical protein [Burkholderiales bacterium]